jgi:hypothetical protein
VRLTWLRRTSDAGFKIKDMPVEFLTDEQRNAYGRVRRLAADLG